jgi:hypothetical protein
VVSARLLDHIGQPPTDLPLTHTTAAVEVRLALGGLAAADYVIEINANFHGESAQQFVAFRLAAR